MKCIKKPVPHPVVFAAGDGVLETREGLVAFAAGDAIVTGVEGECWPIGRARFERDYVALNTGEPGCNGLYMKQPQPVEAEQLTQAHAITLSAARGVLTTQPGDWLITAADGEQWVVADAIFRQTYRACDDPEPA